MLTGNRYQLHESLGMGGMGTVYRALDRVAGRDVALKRVQPADNMPLNARVALTQEFRLLASLHHPHIISVLDYGFEPDGTPYYTMDYLESPVPLTAATLDVVELLLQFLQALAYIHRRGIVHRDLKPGNVLVTNGLVKVLDFGLALEAGQRGDPSGTLAYMAPEVLQGSAALPASDLYAFGVMAYEMLIGRHPFQAETANQLIEDVMYREPDLTPLVAQPARDILKWLLVKQPSLRYASASAVMEDLCRAFDLPVPVESVAIRESFLESARFVGRSDELSQLTDAMSASHTGQGSLWLIGGESGVGKSRLVDELRIRSLVDGVLVLRGQGVVTGGKPFQLWGEALFQVALNTEIDPVEAAVLKEIVPDIDTVLDGPVPDLPVLSSDEQRQRLLITIVELLRRMTSERTVLLILEDLQWTHLSLEPLKQLASIVSDLRLLIVGTYRDDERSDLGINGAQHMKLDRLPPDAIAELSTAMLGEAGQRAEVLDLLQRETEGNVFFLVEVVRTLAEDAGSLSQIGSMTLPPQVFAGGMREIVRRRLDRVPEAARRLLRIAAVAGRQIDLNIMRQFAGDDELRDWLTLCANLAVIEQQNDRWRFAHDKLREGVVEQLSDADQRDLHGQVAEAMERVYPDDPTRAIMLAQHWQAAGVRSKEGYYAHIAGERLMKVSSFQRAAGFLRRALAALTADRDRLAVLRRLGDACRVLTQYEEARAYLDEALALARRLDDTENTVRALYSIGLTVYYVDSPSDARVYFEEALTLARSIGHPECIACALDGLALVARIHANLSGARRYLAEALDLRRGTEDRDGYAGTLLMQGEILHLMGESRSSLDYYEEALAIQRDIGNRLGIAKTFASMGRVYEKLGDYDRTRTYIERSLTIHREIGNRIGVINCLNNLGNVASSQGDYPAAQFYYEESLQALQRVGAMRGQGAIYNNLGNVAMYQGDYDTAHDYHQQALTARLRDDDRRGVGYAYNNLGRVAFGRGDYAAALDWHERALAERRAIDEINGVAYSLYDAGFALLHLDQPDRARECFRDACRIAHENGYVNIVLATLIGFAALALHGNCMAEASELVGLAAHHPALHAYDHNTHLRPLLDALPHAAADTDLDTLVGRYAGV